MRAGAQLRRALALTVRLCVCAAVPATAAAQTSPALVSAVQLAAAGNGDSARRVVAGVLANSRPGDTLYVEALYTRGRLAATSDSAEHDLRRVAIEFSGSRWAAPAMLRLSQLAMTSGNPTGALSWAQRIRPDYPDSPLRPQAALWGGRAGFDAGQPRLACALLDSARAEAAGDIEFQNQVAFFRERCTAITLAPKPADTAAAHADSAKPAAPAAAPQAAAPRDTAKAAEQKAAPAPEPSGYEVQVAAPKSRTQARQLQSRFTRAGFQARIVPGPGGVYRVRLGPYTTLRAAQDAAARARRLTRERPFVVPPRP